MPTEMFDEKAHILVSKHGQLVESVRHVLDADYAVCVHIKVLPLAERRDPVSLIGLLEFPPHPFHLIMIPHDLEALPEIYIVHSLLLSLSEEIAVVFRSWAFGNGVFAFEVL